MSQPHYGGQWYCFKFSNTFAKNIKGVERTRRRPIPKWIDAAQFAFWQQSWYEIQFSKKWTFVCRYYRIAGRYIFEFSWCSLPCHVLIGNSLLFLLLLILRRGGGLESCPKRGSGSAHSLAVVCDSGISFNLSRSPSSKLCQSEHCLLPALEGRRDARMLRSSLDLGHSIQKGQHSWVLPPAVNNQPFQPRRVGW